MVHEDKNEEVSDAVVYTIMGVAGLTAAAVVASPVILTVALVGRFFGDGYAGVDLNIRHSVRRTLAAQ